MLLLLLEWDYVSELPLTGLFFIPQMKYEYEEPLWNDINEKTKELRQKPVPLPLHPTLILRGPTWMHTQVSKVRNWQLTACAMAWPVLTIKEQGSSYSPLYSNDRLMIHEVETKRRNKRLKKEISQQEQKMCAYGCRGRNQNNIYHHWRSQTWNS